MIKLENVHKQYGNVPVLRGINLEIPDNEIYGIIGLSGAGKSTLLRCLNLLETIDSGKIIVNGKNIHEKYAVNGQEFDGLKGAAKRNYQQKVGMIFQHFNLLESKTVYDNVALPLKLKKQKKKEYDEKVRETLEFVGLREFIDKYPNELSGGQKQRVGIARALVHQPEILLCDEATSALDPQTAKTILELLKKINKTYNITIVLITHQMEVIKEICHQVALIEKGVIIEQGTIFDVFTNPQTQLAKEFVSPIIQQELPEGIKNRLIAKNDVICYRLTFLQQTADEPLLSQITQKHRVQTNILFGSISEIQEQFFGQLTVELLGDAQDVAKVLQELEENHVAVKKINLKEEN